MRKVALLASCLSAISLPSLVAAQNATGGNGGAGGSVTCNYCTINGGGLNGGGGGNGGKATSGPKRGSRGGGGPLTSFRIEVRLVGGQDVLTRNWRRAQNTWVEIYPEGRKEYFDILGTDTVNGCRGTVARAMTDSSHMVFIPSRGCDSMAFYIKDGGNAWGFASEMYDVR